MTKVEFAEQHPEVLSWIQDNAIDGNEFAQSLSNFYDERGYLTPGQINAVKKWSNNPRTQSSAVVDVQNLFNAFQAANESGLKWPVMHTALFVFKRAGDESKNPGCVYVLRDEEYLGKINPKGEFFKSRDCDDDACRALTEVSHNVLEAAIEYGRMTGRCACCHRELSDPKSVEMGIGPICAKNWGLA